MKRLPWATILLSVGASLVLIGVAPLGYLFWRGSTQNWEPLATRISLKRGEFKSPLFTTDLDEDYQVEIYSLPPHQIPLDLDWRITDEKGTIIQSRTYIENREMGGTDAIFTRSYRPKRGLRQRVIVDIHQGVPVDDPDIDTRLHVGLPEKGLQQAYASAAAVTWSLIVPGPGAIMVLGSWILSSIRPEAPAAPRNG